MRPNEKSFSNILGIIVTLEDSLLFQEELRLLMESKYSGKGLNFDTTLAQKVRRSVALALQTDIKTAKVATEEWLKQAEAFFQSLEVLEVSIGFEASAEQISSIAQRARELSGRPLLLSLTYKPYLIGGAEFTFNGEYRDYTLRSKMNQLFTHKQQATNNKPHVTGNRRQAEENYKNA